MKVLRMPIHPSRPDRVCWGCDHYCPASDLACGNGTIRTLHPSELFGEDWPEWFDRPQPGAADRDAAARLSDFLQRDPGSRPRSGTGGHDR
jgi:DUF3079 family protein